MTHGFLAFAGSVYDSLRHVVITLSESQPMGELANVYVCLLGGRAVGAGSLTRMSEQSFPRMKFDQGFRLRGPSGDSMAARSVNLNSPRYQN